LPARAGGDGGDVLGEGLLEIALAAVEELGVDPLRVEPLLDEGDDVVDVEQLAGVDVDADEAVVGRRMDLDAALDDRNPAAVARLAREGGLAGLEDVGLRLLGHPEVEADLVQELVAAVEVAAGVVVAAETIQAELVAPRAVGGLLVATNFGFRHRVLSPLRGSYRSKERVPPLGWYRGHGRWISFKPRRALARWPLLRVAAAAPAARRPDGRCAGPRAPNRGAPRGGARKAVLRIRARARARRRRPASAARKARPAAWPRGARARRRCGALRRGRRPGASRPRR